MAMPLAHLRELMAMQSLGARKGACLGDLDQSGSGSGCLSSRDGGGAAERRADGGSLEFQARGIQRK